MAEEKQTNKKSGDLFSSIGALVGMVASGGNPVGAALGGGLGSLLAGGSMQDAFQSGIGSLLPAATMGPAGVFGNVMNTMGGGASPQQRGAGILSLFGGAAGVGGMAPGMAPGMMGSLASGGFSTGATGVAQGLLQGMGVRNAQGQEDPIMSSILREMLYQQRRPRFENLMSDTEMRQYETGERRPDYRGTPVMRAAGGMIEGPGTGTSDSIPAAIYQNGGRVQEARLSDGEFVMTADAVKGAGGGNRDAGAAKMYQMMNQFERMA